jgi:hypothetical protein
MTTGPNIDTVLEALQIVASLGSASAVVWAILAWKSPQLVREILSFILAIYKGWRTPTRVKDKPKKTQTSADQTG